MPLNRPRPRRRGKLGTGMCRTAGKVTFTYGAGLERIVLMQEHGIDTDPHRPLHLYHCEYGDHYHIGHRPKRLMRTRED